MSYKTILRNMAVPAGLAVLGVLLVMPRSLFASTRQDDIDRIDHAAAVFNQIMAVPDRAIPDEILSSAKCIAIIPGEKKVALGFGGNYGKGVVSCRDANGHWSAPLFISIAGGSWGLQIGGESSDVVMVFRSRQGLDSMLNNKVRIGAGASAAAGPVGRHVGAETDAGLNAEILTYARSKGAFAGISLNGAVLQPDANDNEAMYGTARRNAVLDGTVKRPQADRPLIQALDRSPANQ